MNKNNIMEYINEENKDMVKLVNIDNFIKCMCSISRMTFAEMMSSDEYIENLAYYLNIWAKNKRWLFESIYNHQLTIDSIFERNKGSEEWSYEFRMLSHNPDYYIYKPYLNFIEAHAPICCDGLKEGYSSFNQYSVYDRFGSDRDFPDELVRSINEMKDLKLTALASKIFHLPLPLVDDIGRMLDSNKDNCNLTLSIDPVDILTCSVNPYDWTSCYCISSGHIGSHADGAVAAMVDSNSQIIVGWKDQGKMSVGDFELKDVKYKMFRAWLNTTKDFKAIYVASAYPYRDSNHTKAIRQKVEEIICNLTNQENSWSKPPYWSYSIRRKFLYGYNEFSGDLFVLKEEKEKIDEEKGAHVYFDIEVYDQPIFSINTGEIIIGSEEPAADDDDFNEWLDGNSDIDYEDYYDEETDSYDDDLYWEDRDAERDEKWGEYLASLDDSISLKYGLPHNYDCCQFDGNGISPDNCKQLYVNSNGILEWRW